MKLWKDRGFAMWAKACWLERCGTDLCANINRWLHLLCPFSFISNLFWRLSNKLMHLFARCVMEGSMVFCQKNILGHSRLFHGDYIKQCLLTIMVNQILQLTLLISEIKNTVTAANGFFNEIKFNSSLLSFDLRFFARKSRQLKGEDATRHYNFR